MTGTLTATVWPIHLPGWDIFFAEDPDKDLDFDEGFEEDDLHHSKPPSRRPLLWIALLVIVGALAFWVLNQPPANRSKLPVFESAEQTQAEIQEHTASDFAAPLFSEEQTVVLIEGTGEARLMRGPTDSQPGPIITEKEKLTILDGHHQESGWIYQVESQLGKTGWISGEKIKRAS